jgi:hypothetical protein
VCECCALLGRGLCEGANHSSGGFLTKVMCLSVIMKPHHREAVATEGCRAIIKKYKITIFRESSLCSLVGGQVPMFRLNMFLIPFTCTWKHQVFPRRQYIAGDTLRLIPERHRLKFVTPANVKR